MTAGAKQPASYSKASLCLGRYLLDELSEIAIHSRIIAERSVVTKNGSATHGEAMVRLKGTVLVKDI